MIRGNESTQPYTFVKKFTNITSGSPPTVYTHGQLNHYKHLHDMV